MTGRAYDYKSESICDGNTQIFKDCINSVADLEGNTFAAIKITALGNPLLLQRMTVLINQLQVTEINSHSSQTIINLTLHSLHSLTALTQTTLPLTPFTY